MKTTLNCLYIILVILSLTFLVVSHHSSVKANQQATALLSSDTGTSSSVGAGVWINKDTILTANHVLNKEGVVRITNFGGVTAKAIAIDVKNDLAILKAETPTDAPPALVSCETPIMGTNFYTIGQPIGIPSFTFFGTISSQTMLIPSKGARLKPELLNMIHSRFTASIHIIPGSSGGGAFERESGELIGIATATLGSPLNERSFVSYGISHFINAETVCEFLDKNNVVYAKSIYEKFQSKIIRLIYSIKERWGDVDFAF